MRTLFLPAVGQGSVAVQCRQNDLHLFECLVDEATQYRIIAERELLRRLDGGCSLPLGVQSEYLGRKEVKLKARLLSVDGKMSIESTGKGQPNNAVERILANMDKNKLSLIRKSLI